MKRLTKRQLEIIQTHLCFVVNHGNVSRDYEKEVDDLLNIIAKGLQEWNGVKTDENP